MHVHNPSELSHTEDLGIGMGIVDHNLKVPCIGPCASAVNSNNSVACPDPPISLSLACSPLRT